MPELPEVQTTVSGLQIIIKKNIVSIKINTPKLRYLVPKNIIKVINNRKILWYISLIIIGSLLITRYSINNSKIEIGEQIYSPNDLILNESLPEQIEKEARRDIYLLKLPFSITPANIIKTENPWAFSADSFFSKPKMSRTVNSLNFNNRYDFRVGVLNNAKYNYFGQNMGSSGAYYPLLFHFQIPKSLKNEQLCWAGNIFFQINMGKIIL